MPHAVLCVFESDSHLQLSVGRYTNYIIYRHNYIFIDFEIFEYHFTKIVKHNVNSVGIIYFSFANFENFDVRDSDSLLGNQNLLQSVNQIQYLLASVRGNS
jgi:hypothetical protein